MLSDAWLVHPTPAGKYQVMKLVPVGPAFDNAGEAAAFLAGCKHNGKDETPAAPRQRRQKYDQTPQPQFERHIVAVLRDLGGRATTTVVKPALLKAMTTILKPDDHRLLGSGQERWWNTACWARETLKKAGTLKTDSPVGTWELAYGTA
jgi:hypothetical protein